LIGSRLGPYEITGKLGEGGMGEVFRARDTALEREVAIKVLPEALTRDAERVTRFEREAKVLASLNHPNIAQIYGLETSDERKALVMELVEGPTLAERLAEGPLPPEESLAIAREIALALEAAHEKGIVHRDLKPHNVKASGDGAVKVLDFGLAKAMDPVSSPSGGPVTASPTLMNSPTLTAAGTQLGVILGTAAYMAPEQARGGAIDKRADIWAFGVVLWEMLTGRSLFAADTVPDTLAAVLTREIDGSALPASTPPAIRRLLRRCLARKPKERLHDVADARIVLDEVLAGEIEDPAPRSGAQAVAASSVWLPAAPWSLALLARGLWGTQALRRSDAPATAKSLLRLPLDLGEESVSLSFGASAVLSPDGRRLAWVTGNRSFGSPGSAHLVVRDLDGSEARILPGTEGAQDPVFSPDGEEIAFFSSPALLKVPVAGGTPVRLAEVGLPRGVTWTDDGYLIYNRDVADGLWRVPAAGGTPERLTAPSAEAQERSHRWPCAVPGSRKILFLAQELGQKYEEATIELLDLDTLERTVVHRGGSYPRVTRDGVLLYVRDQALWAARLDPASGRLERQPTRVVDEVAYSEWSGGAQFDVAADGTLVFSVGRSDEAVRVSWFDPASGEIEDLPGEPGFYYTPALASDGRSLALQIYSVGRSDLWIFDLASGGRRRLTFGGRDEYPVWSPDGRWIAFSRLVEGRSRSVARVRADGVGEPSTLFQSDTQRVPTSWSPAGALLFTELHPATHADIWIGWPEDPARPPEPLLATPANESRALFSPDGRWILYESDESGTAEIYARSYPDGAGRWQLSEHGGTQPRWGRDGRAAYFWSREGLERREVREEGNALVPGRLSRFTLPRPVLNTEASGYVVAADGRVLLFPFASERSRRAATTLVLDWDADLARRLGEAR